MKGEKFDLVFWAVLGLLGLPVFLIAGVLLWGTLISMVAGKLK